ncbi:hypothetical protein [Xylophilus sp. GOD-11R]|uniref:hypothetical protein n=1 Tax=Xylophilus sp. GOD-11R TaxID=3089814 RepID=UPI00298CA1A9|nr:hypothetical protein [Xylophilus sp. GOD-11R]WPB58945.1 hypothetical protein R9X41_10045 [Xylophilus sp. GOD-11R]
MHFPLHVHGTTLFPRAVYLDDCWQARIDIVTGCDRISVHHCAGGHPAQAIALAFARVEMRAIVQALHAARAAIMVGDMQSDRISR